jgi:RHS repeat-associated protein
MEFRLPGTQYLRFPETQYLNTSPTARYSISGTITVGGVALSAVRVYTNTAVSATTDNYGNYTIPSLPNATYTLTPRKSGYAFTPSYQSVPVSGANVTGKNFTAVATSTYSMSGMATLNGAALSNVTIWVNGASPSATTTDASGLWSMSGLINATYAVTASKNAYSFYPASQAVVVNFANVTNVNVVAGWAIAVQVTVNSAGLAGVTVSTTGRTAVTDTSGLASLTGLSNGTYTVTPSRSGYTFSPTSYSVTISGGNSNLKTFTATPTGGAAMAPAGESTSQGTHEPNMGRGGENNLEAGQDESLAGPAVMARDGDGELYSSQEEPGVDLAPFIQPEALVSISATYYAWDHLGSIRLVTGPTGQAMERHDFEPFGVELPPRSSVSGNTHLFTGHERDGNSADPGKTGLDYMHFRFYGSTMGRFMKPDDGADQRADNPQSWNLYSYVRGNPVTLNDPTGHATPADVVDEQNALEAMSSDEKADAITSDLEAGPEKGCYIAAMVATATGQIGLGAMFLNLGMAINSGNPGAILQASLFIGGPKGPGATPSGGPEAPQAATKGGGELFRLGTSPESPIRLGTKAAAAEEAIGIHGVSVSGAKPEGPASRASQEAVKSEFKVHETPSAKDPQHKTVELPKPVTKSVADLFNDLFGR